MQDAESAEKSGNLNLALIQLKNAALLEPENGEIRAKLGITLLHSGQATQAERELRQAQKDYGPPEVIIPALLETMLQRKEVKQLLTEFPDPPAGTEDKTTPDVLRARAAALQISGQEKEARAAMDHSLALRRDADGLVASARLAQQQGDVAVAVRQADEAVRLSPANEAAWTLKISLAATGGDPKSALAAADEFVHQAPQSVTAKVMRVEVLLAQNNDVKAKEAVDSLLKEQPKSLYGQYLRAVLLLRAGNYAEAWRVAQELPSAFVQSRTVIARTVATIAAAGGSGATATAILSDLLARNPDDRGARLQLARLRLSQSAPQQALTVLDPLKQSKDASAQGLLAQTYIALGQFDAGISSLEAANSAPRPDPLLERDQALLELQEGESDRAIEELRDSLKRDPNNLQLSVALIDAQRIARKWDEALAVTDRVAKTDPASPLPPFYRGQIFFARGDLVGAAAEFGKAIAKDPKFLPAAFYRAYASLAQGDFPQAKADLQLIVSQEPANWQAYSRLIQIAIQTGQQQDALELFNRAIKAAPKDPAPRLAFASYLMTRGKFTEAQTALAGVLQIAPDNPDALTLQGELELLDGQMADAVKTFRGLAAGKNSSPAGYDLLAKALYASKDQIGAEGAARKAVELAPKSPDAQRSLVDLELAAGKGDAALQSVRAFASANPGPDADLLVSDVLLRLKRNSEAMALLEKSLTAKPDPRVALRLSELSRAGGDTARAKTILADWIRKHPDDVEMRGYYAALLMSSRDSAAARTAYEGLVKERPRDPVVLNNLATLVQKDDPARALSLASAAAQIAPQSGAIIDTFGWTRHLRGDDVGALSVLQHAHELESGNPEISYHLAVVLKASGKPAEAKSLLQSALASNAEFDGVEEAKQALAHW